MTSSDTPYREHADTTWLANENVGLREEIVRLKSSRRERIETLVKASVAVFWQMVRVASVFGACVWLGHLFMIANAFGEAATANAVRAARRYADAAMHGTHVDIVCMNIQSRDQDASSSHTGDMRCLLVPATGKAFADTIYCDDDPPMFNDGCYMP